VIKPPPQHYVFQDQINLRCVLLAIVIKAYHEEEPSVLRSWADPSSIARSLDACTISMGDTDSMESGNPRVRKQDRMDQSSAYIMDKGGEVR
jgi:hypothetical protein